MRYISIFILIIGFIATTAYAGNDEIFKKMLPLAEQGDAVAQYHIGMFYNNGIGTEKNAKLAFEWFQKSAANNNPLGAYKVGCYYSGQGQEFMAVNSDKALEYKLIAANAGYSFAQFDVAKIQFNKNNTTEAIKWLKMAGNQGDFESLYALYSLYYQGNKVQKDNSLAYLYLNLAIKESENSPPKEIKSALQELTKNIPESDRTKTDKYISEWQPKPTELTIQAMSGLKDAEDFIKTHK